MLQVKSRIAYLAAVSVAILALLAVGFHVGLQALQDQLRQALGADSEIGEMHVGWTTIELRHLRLPAPAGWPAGDALRAERVAVQPDFLALLTGKPGANWILVEGGYLSALRTADGRLRVVPGLTEGRPGSGAPLPPVAIGTVQLRHGTMEFFDASVRQPPHRVMLQGLDADIGPLSLPDLAGQTRLRLDASLRGAQHDGRITVEGWSALASRELDITATLRGVDLIALAPYLVKAADTGIKRGHLDLDLHATVKDRQLLAPGTLTLDGLELDTGGGSFLGVPRKAAVGLLKDKQDRITVRFVLEGNLDDPKFRLNEGLALRFSSGLAEALGVSLEGVVQGVGSLGRKSAEAVGGAAEGVGQALRGLFGK